MSEANQTRTEQISGQLYVAPRNRPYSVSELSRLLKTHIEDRFSHIQVRGEISGVKTSRLGHMYFVIKDEGGLIDAVCWRGIAEQLSHPPQEGLEVILHGTLSIYAKSSRYQLLVEALEPAGEGALLRLLEERRRKLTQEGLFAAERKRRLPLLPRRIAVLTSEQGAVLHDILHRLQARCPVPITLFPIAVQGREAQATILAAFRLIETQALCRAIPDLDLVIVARGGGSIEDLWVFNEEAVLRAAVACRLPVISAIGHQSDRTLLDDAADARAPTPTAAAEMAVPDRVAQLAHLAERAAHVRTLFVTHLQARSDRLKTQMHALPFALRHRLTQASSRFTQSAAALRPALLSYLQFSRTRLESQRLSPRWLRDALARARASLLEQSRKHDYATRTALRTRRLHLESLRTILHSLSHKRILARGFALVRVGETIIRSAYDLRDGQAFDTLFADDSRVTAVVHRTRQQHLKL